MVKEKINRRARVDRERCVERSYFLLRVQELIEGSAKKYAEKNYEWAEIYLMAGIEIAEKAAELGSPLATRLIASMKELLKGVEERIPYRKYEEAVERIVARRELVLWGQILDDYLACMEEVAKRRR